MREVNSDRGVELACKTASRLVWGRGIFLLLCLTCNRAIFLVKRCVLSRFYPFPCRTSRSDYTMATFSIYGSHHAALAVEKDGSYHILQLDSFLKRACSGLTHFHPVDNPPSVGAQVYLKLRSELNLNTPPETYLYSELGVTAPFFAAMFNADNSECHFVEHHRAHAANSFYQSPFDSAVVISCDSGGDDGLFNIYIFHRAKEPRLVAKLPLNLGYTYAVFGSFIKIIGQMAGSAVSLLTYADKIMNLAPFGGVRAEWLPIIERLFRAEPLEPGDDLFLPLDSYNQKDLQQLCGTLSRLLGQPLQSGIDGCEAYDLAATVQRALENVFVAAVSPYIAAYPSLPICLGGGVAKNVYLHRRVRQEFKRDVFIPTNCDNSGIALGMIVAVKRPETRVDFSHAGPYLLDREQLQHFSQAREHREVSPRVVAHVLADGKLLGIVRGRADHGGYSLGARSIVCDAASPNVAHVIRRGVKKVPEFTPFDALIRVEKLAEYLHGAHPHSYPNYPWQIKENYKALFPGIVHVDGTVRVYAVHKKSEPWLYELLRWFETYSGHGVLLTTPFCREGEPLIATVEAALQFLDSTLLEGVVVEDRLFWRNPRGKEKGQGE